MDFVSHQEKGQFFNFKSINGLSYILVAALNVIVDPLLILLFNLFNIYTIYVCLCQFFKYVAIYFLSCCTYYDNLSVKNI